jgi:hypothetical protein
MCSGFARRPGSQASLSRLCCRQAWCNRLTPTRTCGPISPIRVMSRRALSVAFPSGAQCI